ncbi:tryptophan halogenase [Sphingomonas jejuensis]|uniref:Tryptophan halogenase n=1 Tax=Sphingomonas jejuensis TaxID=904715 RepID=A0ABX0XLN4_9SPHN|nr:tryptophan 7-halogenase [Sphingomonas jejuensis]NJC34144.1 tryptophan halogenase [Sphingomonas jejuensis]
MIAPAAPTIIIAGDGLLAWLAAVRLAAAVGGSRVRVVPAGSVDHGIGPVGPSAIALPQWTARALAADSPVADALGEAATGWVQGIGFRDWSGRGTAAFWSFGDVGAPLDGIPFHQILARWRADGRPAQGADFSLAALAARAGRGIAPAPHPGSPLSTLSPGVMLSVTRFAAALRTRATARAVELLAPLAEARIDETGQIDHLRLQDETEVRADLYVDCTGEQRRLIDRVAGDGFDPWRDRLPCDRVTWTTAAPRAPQPFAIHRAEGAGWAVDQWTGDGWVTQRIGASIFGADGAPFLPGAHRRPWSGNVVALGSAALVVDPLHALPLATAADALDLLLTLLPATPGGQAEASQFNRVASRRHARVRDLSQLPYRLNRRRGEPFWDAVRAAPADDALLSKIALFESRGRVSMLDDEPVDEDDWIWLLDMFAASPRRQEPRAAALPLTAIEAHLARVRDRLVAAVRDLPPVAATH